MKKKICFALVFIFILVALPLYAYEPNQCTRCILEHRPDILPFYKQNGWDISQWNWDNIIANWCGIDPNGCALEKEKCWDACNPVPTPCTQCIMDHRPDIRSNFASWGWDVSEVHWNGIIVHWCGLDPNGCEAEKQNCGESCGVAPPPDPCTQCILDKHPELTNPPSFSAMRVNAPKDYNKIVKDWCDANPWTCALDKEECSPKCDPVDPTRCNNCIKSKFVEFKKECKEQFEKNCADNSGCTNYCVIDCNIDDLTDCRNKYPAQYAYAERQCEKDGCSSAPPETGLSLIYNSENSGIKFKQIDVGDQDNVWGVDKDDNVYHFNGDNKWYKEDNAKLSQVAVGSDGSVWGVNSSGNVYMRNTNGWSKPYNEDIKKFKQISVWNKNNICGVGLDNNIYRLIDVNEGNVSKKDWIPMTSDNNWKQVAVQNNGVIWGITKNGDLYKWYRGDKIQNAGLKNVKQISVGNRGDVWVLKIYYSPFGGYYNKIYIMYFWTGAIWQRINTETRLKYVSVVKQSDPKLYGEFWGIGVDDNIYKMEVLENIEQSKLKHIASKLNFYDTSWQNSDWRNFNKSCRLWDPFDVATNGMLCTKVVEDPISGVTKLEPDVCRPCQTYTSLLWYLSGVTKMDIESHKIDEWFCDLHAGTAWTFVPGFYKYISDRYPYLIGKEFGKGAYSLWRCEEGEITNLCNLREGQSDNAAEKEFESTLHIGDIIQYYGWPSGGDKWKHSVIVVGFRDKDNKPLVASMGCPQEIGFAWDEIFLHCINFDFQAVRAIHMPVYPLFTKLSSPSLQANMIITTICNNNSNMAKTAANLITQEEDDDIFYAQVGQKLLFQSGAINIGYLDADQAVSARWSINRKIIQEENYGAMPAFSEFPSSLQFVFNEPGEYQVVYEVNVDKKAKDDASDDDRVTKKVIISGVVTSPDLKPNPITHEPAIISLGKEIRFRSGINNIGKVNAGAFRVKWSVNGQEVLTKDYPNGCPANGSIIDSPELKWTFSQPGTYRVAFAVDSGSQVEESDETNNEAFIVITPNELLPDLKPLFPITHTPTQVVVGQQVRFQSGVNNVGKADAGVFYARWFVNGKEVAYGKYPGGCKAGQTIVGEPGVLFWTPTAPGNYTITFEVDSGNQVKEESENNNTTSTMILVKELLPDLKPLFPITHTPTQAVVGRQVRFQSGVNNVGKADAGLFFARWFINGKEVAYGKYPAGCKVGQTIVGEPGVLFWTPTAPGNYTITFEVDTGNQVKEESENNNTTATMILVKELLPDLKPIAPIQHSPIQTYVGQKVTFTSGAVNVGNAASGAFNVKWFVNGVGKQTRRYAGCAMGQTLTGAPGIFEWIPTNPGNHTIVIEVDSGKEIKEKSENNNTTMTMISVRVPIPAAPSDLKAVALSTKRIRLTWSDNSNNETGFRIAMRNGGQIAVAANTNTYIWSGLAPNRRYCFQVQSYNATGSSTWSYEACATTRKAN